MCISLTYKYLHSADPTGWAQRQFSELEAVSSSPAGGQDFFILQFSLSSCGLHVASANTNEISRDLHLTYTLF